MAPVRWRSPYGGAAGRSAGGGRELGVHVLVQAEAEAGAGVAVGTAADEGTPQPAAVVALHVARHVEGACPSFSHVAPRGGLALRRPQSRKKVLKGSGDWT